MTALVYAREPLVQARGEAAALVAAHWDEVAHDQACRRLDPDWDAFLQLEAAGQLFLMTARLPRSDGVRGELVGYVLAILRPHFHARGQRIAFIDAVYLAPPYRAAGVRLLRHADTALATLADFIYWHVKPERDFGPTLQRCVAVGQERPATHRYHFIETIWGRATGRDKGG